MPIIDIQKRARELGRIRIGQVVGGTNGRRGRPEKLDRFRFTSASKPLLDKVAALYGGTVREWTPANGGPQQWEVVTNSNRIPVMVPPQPVTQWMELWAGGGCKRRCDGQHEQLSDSPCLCAREDEQVCKPTTRLNVVLSDVEGIGVWRLESHGWYAAMELPQLAEFLANAGGYVNAHLGLEERIIKREGEQTRRFMVPTLEIDVTPSELMAGRGVVSIEARKQDAPALEAGPAVDYVAMAEQAADLDAWRAIWEQAKGAGHLTPDLKGALTAIGQRLKPAAAEASSSEAVEAEPDADSVWQEIITVAGRAGMELPDLEADFVQWSKGIEASDADGRTLVAYLDEIKGGGAAA